MIKDPRIKVAAALMVGVLSLIGGAHAASAATPATRYACDERQNMVVQRAGSNAHVDFIDRSYDLRRARSSIGVKYVSDNAALIIDGRSAVFVAEDRLQLGACVEAMRIAAR
jgi:hypothetical protein